MTTRIKLSTLWVIVMLNMGYADILSLYIPGVHEELAAFAGGTPITMLMLFGAIKIQFSIGMIYLSRVLSFRATRWANIIIGITTIIFVVGGGSLAPHYIFIASIEVLLILLIIRTAWRWKSDEDSAVSVSGRAA
ncbi:MAG: DUF6326 family protein [Devosiaceae bacterium]|nr:DUF6326 family protein [Devosiaceae bacterium]